MSEKLNKPIPRVLWLTNIATPYRIPVWRWFASQVDLTIGLLSNTEQNRWWKFTKEEMGIDARFLDVRAIRYRERSIYLPSRRLRKLLSQDWDVIILGGWESPAYLYGLFVAKLRGIRTVSHYGSTSKSHAHSKGIVDQVRSRFYRAIDAHASYGSSATASLISMGVAPSRIFTGFNSVDHELFNRESKRLRGRINSSAGHKFLYVGQILDRKNIANLVIAFDQMCSPEDTLRIVGSGPYEAELSRLIVSTKSAEQITLSGPKLGEELFLEYAQANTLVLPSTNEVWGLVVNEALASEIHVVVSRNCGAADDVAGMAGVHVCDPTREDLTRAMLESKGAWRGPVENPEILKFTPAVYGKAFLDASVTDVGAKENR